MRNGNYADYQGVVEEEDQPEQSRQEDGPWTTVGMKGKNRPAIKETSTAGQQQGGDGQAAQPEGAAALPTRWARLIEEDFPELPTGGKSNSSAKQNDGHPRKNSTSQQADKSNSNNQQKSKSTSNSTSRNAAPYTNSNKPNSKSSSRGTSRNSSRQPSKERGASKGDKNNSNSRQGSRPSSPPPFRSYFSGRVLNTSEEPRLARRKDTSDSSRQAVHEQYHRKR
jgi:hypothetical protein